MLKHIVSVGLLVGFTACVLPDGPIPDLGITPDEADAGAGESSSSSSSSGESSSGGSSSSSSSSSTGGTSSSASSSSGGSSSSAATITFGFSSLPAGDVGVPYNFTLTATGGRTPYTWSVATGDRLPMGLMITGSAITGTPTVVETRQFNIEVRDANGVTARRLAGIQVRGDTTGPATAVVTAAYADELDRVLIRFTAPGDDGNSGTAASYELRRSDAPITAGNFASATLVDLGAGHPRAGGQQVEVRLMQSWGGQVQHYALRAVDDFNNASVSASLAVDTARSVSIMPAMHAFPEAPFHATSNSTGSAVTVNISVPMQALADVNVADFALAANDHFQLSNAPTLPLVLKPGNSHMATLRFQPRAAGAHMTTLTVAHNAPQAGAMTGITVTGTGVNRAPTLVATDAVLAPRNMMVAVNVRVRDANGAADVASASVDLTALGGASSVAMTPATPMADDAVFTAMVDVGMAAAGSYALPVTATDAAGAMVTGTLGVVVYEGTVREVGADKTYTNIKDAVAAAADGDLVAVFPGTYSGANARSIAFPSKRLIILGVQGAGGTIVDCEASGRAISLVAPATGPTANGSVISGLTFRNCAASAILVDGLDIGIRDSIFVSNTSPDDGGALRVAGAAADVGVYNSQFSMNTATLRGGAIGLQNGARLVVEDSEFANNVGTTGGGAINADGERITVRRSRFDLNRQGAEVSIMGGAVRVGGGCHAEVSGSHFEGNGVVGSSNNGSGIYFDYTSVLRTRLVDDCTFVENVNGSGVYAIYGHDLEVRNTTFSRNQGGGVSAARGMGTGPVLEDLVFEDHNTGGYSAVANLTSGGRCTRCEFRRNSAPPIRMDNGVLEDSDFVDNVLPSNAAMGAGFQGGAGQINSTQVRRCLFRNNRGPSAGALATGGNTFIYDSIFDGNTSESRGGAVMSFNTGLSVTNSLLINNIAMGGNGVGALEPGTAHNMAFRNCTIVGNRSPTSGVYENNATGVGMTFSNSILWGNTATNPSGSRANDILVLGTTSTFINVNNTILLESGVSDAGMRINSGEGYVVGMQGNLAMDPLFVNAAAGDYRLQAGSPAVNAGSQTALAAGLQTMSVLEDGTLDTGTVDLGYHYTP